MTSLRIRIVTLSLALAGLSLALLAACNDGDNAGEPTSAPTAQGATATPTEAPRLASEWGEAPIYWRSTTGLESLQVCVEPCIGEKVIFRIANGYAEETLLLVAERESDGLRVEFEANRAETQDELPGSFYPLNLALPEPGAWLLTVVAGDDEVVIPIEVAPAES